MRTVKTREPSKNHIRKPYTNKIKRQGLETLSFQLLNAIPAAGVEPARPCGHWILSPARLPIPPRRHQVTGVAGFEPTHEGVKVPCLTAWLYPNNK